MQRIFKNREDAGQQLGAELQKYQLQKHQLQQPVIIALPRGGVPVAFEVAKLLEAPLEVLLVRKIGAPYQPELAIGAVADGSPPHIVIDWALAQAVGASDDYVQQETARQIEEIKRRREKYGMVIAPHDLQGHTAVLVDDGIATGATARVALAALRQRQPARVVLAMPVAATEAYENLRAEVDEFVCLNVAEFFPGVGGFYRDFTQVEDRIVIDLLRSAQQLQRADVSQ